MTRCEANNNHDRRYCCRSCAQGRHPLQQPDLIAPGKAQADIGREGWSSAMDYQEPAASLADLSAEDITQLCHAEARARMAALLQVVARCFPEASAQTPIVASCAHRMVDWCVAGWELVGSELSLTTKTHEPRQCLSLVLMVAGPYDADGSSCTLLPRPVRSTIAHLIHAGHVVFRAVQPPATHAS
jgi:hypothetical protein